MDPTAPSRESGHAWIRNNILGLVAIFIALSGTAVAANVASQPGAHPAKKKKVKRGPVGPQGPQGPPGAPGAPGSALGFAQVTAAGDVLEAQTSPGIEDGDVTFTGGSGNGYCFTGLPFTPKNAQVTEEYGSAGTTITRSLVGFGDTASCPGSSEQVTVFWTDTNTFGIGQQTGFFILFN